MRTVQVETSTNTLLMGMASGPGLMSPVTFLPSQFMTSVTGCRWVAVGPQSPDQVPVKGYPCWANANAVPKMATQQQASRVVGERISPPGGPAAPAGRCSDRGPLDTAQPGDQFPGVGVHIDTLAATAVAAGPAHGIIQ